MKNFHFFVSLIKSLVRISGFVVLAMNHISLACFILIFAEVLGILEEMFE